MSKPCKYRILTDSDGCHSLQLEFPGFIESWGYATGDEENSYWEFDLCSNNGMEMHFAIPYSISPDVLETLFYRCLQRFQIAGAA